MTPRLACPRRSRTRLQISSFSSRPLLLYGCLVFEDRRLFARREHPLIDVPVMQQRIVLPVVSYARWIVVGTEQPDPSGLVSNAVTPCLCVIDSPQRVHVDH